MASAIFAAAGLSSPSRTRPNVSTRRSCARRWKPPSALPTPPALGTGSRLTTPARRRPFSSSANTAKALFRKAASPAAAFCRCWSKIAGLLADAYPPLRGGETFQQFSTPIPLGLVAATAAAITPADRVLEPSAGTGLLAILGRDRGRSLILNELAETRARLLSSLFPAVPVTRFDAAQIDDHLDAAPCRASC
jgi:hypothetical protein